MSGSDHTRMPPAGQTKPPLVPRLTDRIVIGVLTRTFPPELVDRVDPWTGRGEQRRRLLRARVVVYYTLAMCLFAQVGYEEVMRLLVEGLGFTEEMHPAPTFAMLSRGDLRLVLSAPGGGPGGGQAMPDGRLPEPEGWNRFQLEVSDLAATVETLRTTAPASAMTSSSGSAASRSCWRIRPVIRLNCSSQSCPRPRCHRIANVTASGLDRRLGSQTRRSSGFLVAKAYPAANIAGAPGSRSQPDLGGDPP